MPTPIKMPALSPTMEEGTLARWLIKPGDKVSACGMSRQRNRTSNRLCNFPNGLGDLKRNL